MYFVLMDVVSDMVVAQYTNTWAICILFHPGFSNWKQDIIKRLEGELWDSVMECFLWYLKTSPNVTKLSAYRHIFYFERNKKPLFFKTIQSNLFKNIFSFYKGVIKLGHTPFRKQQSACIFVFLVNCILFHLGFSKWKQDIIKRLEGELCDRVMDSFLWYRRTSPNVKKLQAYEHIFYLERNKKRLFFEENLKRLV